MKPNHFIIHPQIGQINLTDPKLSAFWGDGSGYVTVTDKMIENIKRGDVIITEYHEYPLGNVIYVTPHYSKN